MYYFMECNFTCWLHLLPTQHFPERFSRSPLHLCGHRALVLDASPQGLSVPAVWAPLAACRDVSSGESVPGLLCVSLYTASYRMPFQRLFTTGAGRSHPGNNY